MSFKPAYILFFILLSFGAKTNGFSSKVEAWDESYVDYRLASAEKMEMYKKMGDYNYERYKKPESIWDKIKRWFASKFVSADFSDKVLMYIFLGLAVLILLFVMLKLLGVKITGLLIFSRDTKVTSLGFKQGEEDIYDENLEKTLEIAIKNKAFREAVRLMYLLALRDLDNAGVIEWKPWKTNREYYYEVNSPLQKQMFKQLYISYEYIWYGLFKVEDEKFEVVQQQFTMFQKELVQSEFSA